MSKAFPYNMLYVISETQWYVAECGLIAGRSSVCSAAVLDWETHLQSQKPTTVAYNITVITYILLLPCFKVTYKRF